MLRCKSGWVILRRSRTRKRRSQLPIVLVAYMIMGTYQREGWFRCCHRNHVGVSLRTLSFATRSTSAPAPFAGCLRHPSGCAGTPLYTAIQVHGGRSWWAAWAGACAEVRVHARVCVRQLLWCHGDARVHVADSGTYSRRFKILKFTGCNACLLSLQLLIA